MRTMTPSGFPDGVFYEDAGRLPVADFQYLFSMKIKIIQEEQEDEKEDISPAS